MSDELACVHTRVFKPKIAQSSLAKLATRRVVNSQVVTYPTTNLAQCCLV